MAAGEAFCRLCGKGEKAIRWLTDPCEHELVHAASPKPLPQDAGTEPRGMECRGPLTDET